MARFSAVPLQNEVLVSSSPLDPLVSKPKTIPTFQGSSDPQPQEPLRGRILLVDDDEDLRRLLRALLEGDGYEVFACRDAERALRVFISRGDIDLLLTDYQMPQMSGIELSNQITAIRPSLPVIILSGVVLPDAALDTIAASGWELIAKPCEVPVLLQKIAAYVARKQELSQVASTTACAP